MYYKHELKELKEYISIVEQHKNGIMWLKIKNEILFSNEDIYICHSYIPPASSKVLFDQQFDFFEEIEKGIEKHSKNGKTFIVGDFSLGLYFPIHLLLPTYCIAILGSRRCLYTDRLGTGCNVVCTASTRIFAPWYHRVISTSANEFQVFFSPLFASFREKSLFSLSRPTALGYIKFISNSKWFKHAIQGL